MSLKFYNTLSAKKEKFVPLEKGAVRMYTCGPTVYDYAHIGNFRAYVFEDLLRRYLKYKGYTVVQVMNITDVDDKTIKGALEQNVALDEFTAVYIRAFKEDLQALNIEEAEHYPRATEYIKEMVAIVQKLLDKKIAYESDGSIYYRIQAFSGYGKLSKKNLDQNIVGARVDHDEYERDDYRDFVLWKKHKEGEPYWDSPFGKGRPGWHIECSAMSMKHLGETFDIHTGGEDNIFPHHENEIAQSEGATGKEFVKYWLHCRFLLVNNEKMSKSKGNFYTLRDLFEKGYLPLAIRYLLLSHNYRQPLNFTLPGIEQAQASIRRIKDFLCTLTSYDPKRESDDDCSNDVKEAKKAFEEALDDDLNIAQALAVLFDFVSLVHRKIANQEISQKGKTCVHAFVVSLDKVLGILDELEEDIPARVEELAQERLEARAAKNYKKADEIRDKILELGWIVEDTAQGPRVKKR